MNPVNFHGPLVGLKTDRPPPDNTQPDQSDAVKVEEKKEAAKEKLLVCASCHHVITRPAARISINGAHQHSFANPSGLIFEIGCFNAAPGCDHVGRASDEFTWFKGYQWRIAVCRNCLAHLGWEFASSGTSFYGLILTSLNLSEQ
jgi:hypothetical protein